MAKMNNLYDKVVDISRDYLGPAAERFIERQVVTHLKKEPAKLTRRDLIKLIDWIKLAFALLTNEPETVDEYIGRLRTLTNATAPGTKLG